MEKEEWIEKFKQQILPQIVKEYRPKRILLFGSRIKRTSTMNSDLDVLIISDLFYNIPFISRMSHILKKFKFTKHIDYLCYTPEEFDRIKDKSSILIDALEYAETII